MQPQSTNYVFDAAVLDASGSIDVKSLGALLGLSEEDLTKALCVRNKIRRSGSTPIAPEELLKLLNVLAESLQSRENAIYWFDTPQHQLSEETPMKWLVERDFDGLVSYVDAFVRFQPD